jgi:hypothetical protein
MEIVVSRNRAPVFAAPFSGIALEYAWTRIVEPKPTEEVTPKEEAAAGEDLTQDAAGHRHSVVPNEHGGWFL